jgi:secreted trypsin-like serine protease
MFYLGKVSRHDILFLNVIKLQGDSGAPLVYTDEINGEQTLIGVASFGHPFGCEKDSDNVYVRTSCYITWLEQEGGIPVRP